MRQRLESQPANPRFRSLLSSTISGKGLFVQALAYPFALPAIANTPPAAIVPPLPRQADDADIYTPSTAALLLAATVEESAPVNSASAYIPSESFQPLPAQPSRPVSTLIPQVALASPTTDSTAADLALSPIESAPIPEHLDAIAHPRRISAEVEVLTGVEQPLANTPSEDAEFSWFSLDGLTQEAKANNSHKLAFTTQVEPPSERESSDLPILLAGPQDLNPGLSEPPEPLPSQIPNNPPNDNNLPNLNNPPTTNDNLPTAIPTQPNSDVPAQSIPVESYTPEQPQEEASENRSFLDWNDLEVGINSDFNNFGESSWSVLPAISGQLANGNTVGIASGVNQFDQTDFESVTHVPLTLSWQGKAGDVTLKASGGIDLFNRLPLDAHAGFTAAIPLSEKANISVGVEQGPFLLNAQTLENQISRWQYGPEIYWEISPKITLFSKLRLANYSDGNFEQQSFSRIERKIGETASVALTLINQSFQESVEETSGYFSPRDFLVAAAELSWQESITDRFSCGLLGSIGQQRLAGEWALAYNGQALCSVDVGAALQVDLGYRFSNVSKDQSALVEDSAFSNQQIISGIRVRF